MLQLLEGNIHDIQSVSAILEILYPDSESSRDYHTPPARGNDSASGLWLAQLEGQTVGFAHFRTSEWHPKTDYLTVAVHPAGQQQGIGTQLLKTLNAALEGRNRRQQTALLESQTVARTLLEKRGFEETMRTYTVEVPASHISLEPFMQAHARALEMGLTFGTLLKYPQLSNQVALLQHRVYQATHTNNPVPDFPLERLHQTWLSSEAHFGTLFLALLNEKPIGFAALYGEGAALELAYFGTDPEHASLEPWLSKAVVGRALEFAAARGAVLEAEFDSLNPAAMAVLEGLGVDPGEAWVTYQRAPRTS